MNNFSEKNSKVVFLNRPSSASFFVYLGLFKQTLQFLQQYNVKNFNPVSGGEIWTHFSPITTRAGRNILVLFLKVCTGSHKSNSSACIVLEGDLLVVCRLMDLRAGESYHIFICITINTLPQDKCSDYLNTGKILLFDTQYDSAKLLLHDTQNKQKRTHVLVLFNAKWLSMMKTITLEWWTGRRHLELIYRWRRWGTDIFQCDEEKKYPNPETKLNDFLHILFWRHLKSSFIK